MNICCDLSSRIIVDVIEHILVLVQFEVILQLIYLMLRLVPNVLLLGGKRFDIQIMKAKYTASLREMVKYIYMLSKRYIFV